MNVYKLYKFQIDGIKIEAYLIQNTGELLRIKKFVLISIVELST